jgi:hypothetical protein
MLRNLNSNFRFQIRPVTGRDFPVTAVTGNPDPPRDFFSSIGNQNLGWDVGAPSRVWSDGRDVYLLALSVHHRYPPILHNSRVASYSLRSIKLVDKMNVSRYIYIRDKFYEDEGGTFLLGMLCSWSGSFVLKFWYGCYFVIKLEERLSWLLHLLFLSSCMALVYLYTEKCALMTSHDSDEAKLLGIDGPTRHLTGYYSCKRSISIGWWRLVTAGTGWASTAQLNHLLPWHHRTRPKSASRSSLRQHEESSSRVGWIMVWWLVDTPRVAAESRNDFYVCKE